MTHNDYMYEAFDKGIGIESCCVGGHDCIRCPICEEFISGKNRDKECPGFTTRYKVPIPNPRYEEDEK